MSLQRFKLLSALQARLKDSVPSVNKFPPVGEHRFHQYDIATQPVLSVIADKQSPQQSRGMPTAWRVMAHVLVYVPNGNEELLLRVVDEVEKALEVKPGEEGDGVHTTLGGLVSHCWIAGSIDILEGDVSEQAMLVIPVEMLAVA